VALTNVVVRLAPFQRTTDDETNLLPFTVNVNAGPPVAALVGAREVATGTGLTPGSTVTVGLVATRVYPLLRNKRNSYVPGVAGIGTVQVLVVMLAPTKIQFR
jgi:hypothetical protein